MQVRLDHVALETDRLEETRSFLESVLGLEVGPRPAVTVRGYWLYADGAPIVHLMERADGGRASQTPAIHHIALSGGDFDTLAARLEAAGVTPHVVELPGANRRQVFFREPAG
ncbi:MAG: VOC family protein, partial [Pseudomonadota bacterium]